MKPFTAFDVPKPTYRRLRMSRRLAIHEVRQFVADFVFSEHRVAETLQAGQAQTETPTAAAGVEPGGLRRAHSRTTASSMVGKLPGSGTAARAAVFAARS